ncbi:universal stress protein [Suttonella sp. R2A3]|uniref:universal stress protein n=1 Tax=Suttonella sp. R2A3 TaxID=2908648 RepID=UPI001F298C9F|nr:universal stress protein [Suttonella sp. R2A3]UJF25244.1 universal stress protein [Suttonella sp. R2A3]
MFAKIMVAIDLNHEEQAVRIINHALAVGNNDTVYQLVHVIPPLGAGFVSSFLPKDYDTQLIKKGQEELHAFSKKHFPQGVKVQHMVAHGSIYEEINRLATEQGSELVILSASKPGAKGLGPNAARVSRYSDKSVMVIR